MSKWIEIEPRGYLKNFGKQRFYVDTPAEALRAMLMQVKGFKEAFEASEKKGLKFALVTDKRNIDNLEELHMGSPSVVKIIPTYAGRKKGGLGMIFTAIIIAAAIVFAPAAGFGAGAWLAAGSTSLAVATSVALSLALGGITQLLTPQNQEMKTNADVDNKPSYAFGGPVNTTAQGNPVGVLYGEREIGGAVISAAITSNDLQ